MWYRFCHASDGLIHVPRHLVILDKLGVPQPLEQCRSSVSAVSHLSAPCRGLGYPKASQQAEDAPNKAAGSHSECLYNVLL